MAPLFSKVDLNKFWHDVQNEETMICAKFGNDLFSISKVIGRKKVAQFFDSQCRIQIFIIIIIIIIVTKIYIAHYRIAPNALISYFQLWRSYAILSATTRRIFTFH